MLLNFILNLLLFQLDLNLRKEGYIMEKQDWEMSVEEFNDCGCAMNGD